MWSFESFSDGNWDHVLRVKISKDDAGQTPFNIAAELGHFAKCQLFIVLK